jgi:hypothetical protein
MSRRLAGTTFVTVTLLAGAPSSFAAVDHPRTVCAQRVSDADGDGKYAFYGTGGTNVNDPRNVSIDALDIVSVTLRHTAAGMEAHLKIKNLTGAFSAYETGYRYDVTFENADGAKFLLQALRPNPQWSAVSLLAVPTPNIYPRGSYSVGATTTGFTGVTNDIDVAGGWIVVTVPGDQFDKAFSTPVTDGVRLTKIAAATFAYLPAVVGFTYTRPADTTLASDVAYTVGDDFCFGPPPAALSAFGAPDLQVSDSTTFTATLVSEAGEKLAGKTVEFTVAGEPGMPRKGVTDANGVARATYTATLPAGSYPVTVVFPGDETDGKARLTGTVGVTAEGTKFGPLKVAKPTATTRTVTAPLLDDDNHPVGAQKVDWYVNGKKVATVATDAKGQSVYKGAKQGQTVQARFAGVPGRYLASVSKTAKV